MVWYSFVYTRACFGSWEVTNIMLRQVGSVAQRIGPPHECRHHSATALPSTNTSLSWSGCLRRRGCCREQSSKQYGEARQRSSDQHALEELLTPFLLFGSYRACIHRLLEASHQSGVKRIKGDGPSSSGFPSIRSGHVNSEKLCELRNPQPESLTQMLNLVAGHVCICET